jgi:nucleoid-associated protein YgaU
VNEGPFSPTSRYSGVEHAEWVGADGRVHPYVRRRFVPDPARLASAGTHVVAEGERLDHIAHATYGDAERWWQVCDANAALRPDELLEPIGRKLRLTYAEGIALA